MTHSDTRGACASGDPQAISLCTCGDELWHWVAQRLSEVILQETRKSVISTRYAPAVNAEFDRACLMRRVPQTSFESGRTGSRRSKPPLSWWQLATVRHTCTSSVSGVVRCQLKSSAASCQGCMIVTSPTCRRTYLSSSRRPSTDGELSSSEQTTPDVYGGLISPSAWDTVAVVRNEYRNLCRQHHVRLLSR